MSGLMLIGQGLDLTGKGDVGDEPMRMMGVNSPPRPELSSSSSLSSSSKMPVSCATVNYTKRPRGLWKGRRGNKVTRVAPESESTTFKFAHASAIASDTTSNHQFDDDDDTTSNTSSKRRRYTPSDSEDDDSLQYTYWDYSRKRFNTLPSHTSNESIDSSPRRIKIMDTTSTAMRGAQTGLRTTCDYEDWEDLKELFTKAADEYEKDDVAEALPLIRGVIHECHRFLIFYQEPSVIFSNPPSASRAPSVSPDALTPSEERIARDWGETSRLSGSRRESKLKSNELPTAFHAILGTALFLFGNLIAQDASLVLPGEPDTPCPYWLAALDVFETGENLPSRTHGKYGYDAPEDWRMAIVWGRTLVCLADEAISRSIAKSKSSSSQSPASTPPSDRFSSDEPTWPAESPFSAIAARRPPVTRRLSLSRASPNELMVLAMDQFSRGIFHMPHPQHHGSVDSFSRPKELYTVASEVLGVAERLEVPSERQYWASWADSVFNQMKMEADMDAWRGPITWARGRCWLIVGSARADELETALEKGEMDVLDSEDAIDAREGLKLAISFFERARGSATSASDPEVSGLTPLLAEALLTLANLTIDEREREELYKKAQQEGGDAFDLGQGEPMDESG